MITSSFYYTQNIVLTMMIDPCSSSFVESIERCHWPGQTDGRTPIYVYLLWLLVKLVFGFELRSDTHHLFSNNTTITMVVLRLFLLMNRWLYTNSAYVVWGCVLFNTTKYQIHHQSLTVKIYYDADDRRALSSSHPWKIMSTLMVEQLLPFYLLILWAAVLLSKSMVDAVRLCVHLDLNHFL